MQSNEIMSILQEYKRKNRDKYAIKKIGIFGSAARGSMTSQSDIDIVVDLAKPDLFYLIGIKQDLEEQLHRSVDIVRYRYDMNEFLRRKIEKEARYV